MLWNVLYVSLFNEMVGTAFFVALSMEKEIICQSCSQQLIFYSPNK